MVPMIIPIWDNNELYYNEQNPTASEHCYMYLNRGKGKKGKKKKRSTFPLLQEHSKIIWENSRTRQMEEFYCYIKQRRFVFQIRSSWSPWSKNCKKKIPRCKEPNYIVKYKMLRSIPSQSGQRSQSEGKIFSAREWTDTWCHCLSDKFG